MRRANTLSLRTVRRTYSRKLVGRRVCKIGNSNHVLGLRCASTSSSSTDDNAHKPRASTRPMYFRNFSVALVSGLVASGAWYAYRGASGRAASNTGLGSGTSLESSFTSTGLQSRALTSSSLYSSQVGRSTPTQPTPATGETAESTRRALVVHNDQFFTGPLPGDGPLEKATDDQGRKVLEMLTPEQATQKLRRNEESYLVGRGKGVVRYDVVQIPSNDPIEDDHSEKIVDVPQTIAATENGTPSSDWMFWGVFDGHSGWTTSAALRQMLISFVARELNSTYKAALSDPSLTRPSPESIDTAIKNGFVRLDNEIIHGSVEKVMKANSKRVGAEVLAPALSGSCALLSFYDSYSKLLRVACTGDSRAVLGRKGANGKWVASALSEDQTGSNEKEAERMRREHPGESNVIRNGRVLGGLEPSRAFGDSFYKWSREIQERMKGSFLGRSPSQLLRTPPYVTAEPVITTTQVDPSRGDFVVMATDGLWEMLTNEEVVGLVGQWLESQARPAGSGQRLGQNEKSGGNSWLTDWFSSKGVLPVEKADESQPTQGGQRTPIRQQQWGVNGNSKKRFVVEDKNVATHLVRNALGGKDKDMLCALLTLPSPYSRRYRDDLTVEVIFFGDGPDTGVVERNTEASAGNGNIKAKL